MKRRRGFTLLELMLALSLLTVTVGLLLASSVRSARQVQAAGIQNTLVRYGESRLDDLRYGTALKAGETQGQFSDSRYHWHLKIQPSAASHTASPNTVLGLWQVTLTVSGQGQRVRWQTLRASYVPAQVSPAP
jgi:prepilin-type N-terminal cleavage/methylation domain-containing protein